MIQTVLWFERWRGESCSWNRWFKWLWSSLKKRKCGSWFFIHWRRNETKIK